MPISTWGISVDFGCLFIIMVGKFLPVNISSKWLMASENILRPASAFIYKKEKQQFVQVNQDLQEIRKTIVTSNGYNQQ